MTDDYDFVPDAGSDIEAEPEAAEHHEAAAPDVGESLRQMGARRDDMNSRLPAPGADRGDESEDYGYGFHDIFG